MKAGRFSKNVACKYTSKHTNSQMQQKYTSIAERQVTSTRQAPPKYGTSLQYTAHQLLYTTVHTFISCLHMGQLHNTHTNKRRTALQHAPQLKTHIHAKVKHKHMCARLAERWVIQTRHAPSKMGHLCGMLHMNKQTHTTHTHLFIPMYTWINFITHTRTEYAYFCKKLYSEIRTHTQR